MKHFSFSILLTVLIGMVGAKAYAYDIAVENADGKTIYYNYVNEGKELQVTSGSYQGYSGGIVIPEKVTYSNRTRKVTQINAQTFFGCDKLTSITIPSSMTYIGESAFFGCYGLASVNISDIASWCKIKCDRYEGNPLEYAHHLFLNGVEVKDLVVPNSVTSIGDYAFSGASFITSVTIPSSVTSIGNGAFGGCSSLTSLKISDIASWCIINFADNCSNPLGNHLYSNDKVQKKLVIYLNNKEITDLVIPNSVTSINNYAFCTWSGLTSVTIPNSVTSIGDYAFSGCSGLTSMSIGNSVTSIGRDAFYKCSSLTSVKISNVASWCKIKFDAYSHNPLTYAHHLYLNDVEVINLVIPKSVTSIEDYVFAGCTGLTSVTIPNSVTSIGRSVFQDCSGLTRVTIPKSVTSIGERAFDGVDFFSIVSRITEPFNIEGRDSWNPVFSKNTFNNATLYVPIGTIDKYKATEGWKDFWFIEEGEGSTYVETITLNPSTMNLGVGDTRQLTVEVLPDDATDKSVTWSSDNENIATVSSEGLVTAQSEGNVIIRCKANDGSNIVATCSVTVISPVVAEINKTNFPDENFRNYLLAQSYGSDGVLSESEITGITAIDVSFKSINNLKGIEFFTALKYLYCYRNKISGKNMDDLINSLPQTTNGRFYVIDNRDGDEENVCTKSQVAAAKAKGWTPYFYDTSESKWKEYEGSDDEKAGSIAINETNFPDDNFRSYLLAQSYGSDGVLSESEITGITAIDVSFKSINNLKGIECFRALTKLQCRDNQLTSLDVSKNTALKELYCYSNQLTSLDVSKNTALTDLECYLNQLTSLDVSNCTILTELSCHSNQLTSLNVSNCTALTSLSCSSNQLTSLNVSNCTALTYLYCGSNQLTSLDVSKNTALRTLKCESNQLSSLDVSKNTALKELYCYSNQLTSLDVSKNTALTDLECYLNQLTSLDVSNCSALRDLDCYSNQLTSLDVSNCSALRNLECYSNLLTSLEVSQNIKLRWLGCYRNKISGKNMDELISSLPLNKTEYEHVIVVIDNSQGDEENVCTKSQVAAAKARGWTSCYYNMGVKDYEGSEEETLLGDANGDGVVDVADVVAIVNYILNKPGESFNEKAADVNDDGVIDVADVVAVVNIILKGGNANSPEAKAHARAYLKAHGFIVP